MYNMNSSERERCVWFGVMRWPVLGGTCMTPSALVTRKMINSVKILQQLITVKFAYMQNSKF